MLSKIGTGGWIAIIVIAVGLIVWISKPTSWFGVLLGLLICAPVGALIYWMVQGNVDTSAAFEALRQQGIPGSALVLQSESTPVLVNRQAQVRLRLSVRLPDAEPYEVTRLEIVPRGQAADPGRLLSVYVDRNDRQRMIIDWTRAPAAPPAPTPVRADIAARLAQLEALHRAGQITSQEYQAQRQRILSEL